MRVLELTKQLLVVLDSDSSVTDNPRVEINLNVEEESYQIDSIECDEEGNVITINCERRIN